MAQLTVEYNSVGILAPRLLFFFFLSTPSLVFDFDSRRPLDAVVTHFRSVGVRI